MGIVIIDETDRKFLEKLKKFIKKNVSNPTKEKMVNAMKIVCNEEHYLESEESEQ